jgi:hypothetical protein
MDMVAGTAGGYIGNITPTGEYGSMHYYVSYETTDGERVSKPYGAPLSTFSFNIGADQVPPVVHSISNLNDQFYPAGSYEVYIEASDNIGIGTVELQWRVGNSDVQTAACSEIGRARS